MGQQGENRQDQSWEYSEPPERPRHPRTQIVPWSPQRYSQTRHLESLGYSRTQAPSRQPSSRDPQPSFSPKPQGRPQPRRYEQPRQPQYAPQPQYQSPRQPQDYRPQYRPPAPRRKRRVFLWVFLAVQAVFIIWIVAGLASHPAGPTAAQQAAQQCANGGWQGLFKSQADCNQHYAVALNDAGNVGKGLGVAFIVIIWMVVDFFLGIGYGIYRLASRR
jgi:hypothetical protein